MKEQIINLIGSIPYVGVYLESNYVISAIIIILSILTGKVLLFIFNHYLNSLAKKTKTKFDDMLFDHTKRPFFYLVLAYGFKMALLNLGFGETTTNIVNSFMAIFFVYIIIRVVDIIIETWGFTVAKKTKTRIDEVLLPLMHKVAKVLFVIIALMWVLKIWHIDITPYLAGVGISGLVLGLALQDSLKNIFGGVTLLLDKTYQLGDKVKLESGEVGNIYDIGLRSTKLVTYDNEVVYIPNGYLANSRVLNYTRPNPSVKVSVLFGVEYGNNIKKVQKVVLETIRKMDNILLDPEPVVQFLEMGGSSLNFKAAFWVSDWQESYDKKLEATEKIYDALNKNKINIPFPTQTIYLKK